MSRLRKIRWPLLGAGAAALAVTAVAGATHFGPFNLEHTNGPTDVASGITGSLDAAVLFGSNANTGANAHGVQGGHTAGGTGAGVRGFTNSISPSARGVLGQVTSTAPGSMSAAVRGVNAGTGLTGIGVWGSHNGQGVGVQGSTSNGTGLFGTGRLGVSGIGTDRGVSGSSGAGSGIVGESTTGWAGSFGGGKGVAIDRNLHLRGNIMALPGENSCGRGPTQGIVAVNASGTFSAAYTSVGVTGFNCTGGTVLAKRNGVGNYTVRLGGNASAAWAVGNSTETTNDAFVVVGVGVMVGDSREFQVIVLDKDGGNEDADFVVIAF